MLPPHKAFVAPDPARRKREAAHTIHCPQVASDLGIPAVRLNSGRWNTIKSFDDLMKVKGDEPPLPGYTEQDAFKCSSESIEACLPAPENPQEILPLQNHGGTTKPPAHLLRSYTAGP